MNRAGSLRDEWMWNRGPLRIGTLVPVGAALAVTAVGYPQFGLDALYFLLLALVGPLNSSIYGVVGRKVQAVKASLSTEEGELAECLMVDGNIQSPGVAVLREAELVLAPIVGKRRTIPLLGIESVRETGNMFGKGFIWKRVLILKIPDVARLAFALPGPVARRWKRILERATKAKG